jgi:hypothetical protein
VDPVVAAIAAEVAVAKAAVAMAAVADAAATSSRAKDRTSWKTWLRSTASPRS